MNIERRGGVGCFDRSGRPMGLRDSVANTRREKWDDDNSDHGLKGRRSGRKKKEIDGDRVGNQGVVYVVRDAGCKKDQK